MKSRGFNSKFFTDAYIQKLTLKERWVYLYYLFGDKVNWLGTYELNDRTALFEMGEGITPKELTDIKGKLQKDGKILFVGDYVILKNSERYETHLGNSQLLGTAVKQFKGLPDHIKNSFLTFKPQEVINAYRSGFLGLGYTLLTEYTVAYDVGYTVAYPVGEVIRIKDKEEREKDNRGVVGGKPTSKEQASKVLEAYNRIFGRKMLVTRGIENNLAYWLSNGYDLSQIEQAMVNARSHDFYKDKLTPEMLLRRKNPRGEDVDHIGELCNYVGAECFRSPDGKTFTSKQEWSAYMHDHGWGVSEK